MADDMAEKGPEPTDGEGGSGGHRRGTFGGIEMDTRYIRSLEGLMKLISLVSNDRRHAFYSLLSC